MKSIIWIQQVWHLFAAGAIAGALLCSVSAHAGVGMLAGGESLYVSDVSATGGNAFWDGSRNKIASICKRRNGSLIQGYEYGYSYFHTLIANATLAYRSCGQTNTRVRVAGAPPGFRLITPVVAGQNWGLGDLQLGVRTRLNHSNTSAWETTLTIPTGYDNNSPSRLGRGALGLGLGLRFASAATVTPSSWGWKLGTTYTYFFTSKGNSLRSFVELNYAFTASNFEQTGDFITLRLSNSFGFANGGVQRTLFFNQLPRSLTNSDVTRLGLQYSHSFANGWSTSFRIVKSIFGRSTPVDYSVGWGLSYRWAD